MGRGTWWATVHGVAKELDATEHTHTYLSEDNADILCFAFIIFKGDLMSFMFKAYILFPAFLFW